MAVLIGMSPEVKGTNYNLDREKVTIGRNATNLIVIEHPTVSGKHCCILKDGNRYSLADLGSTNGTRVNSREITESPLRPKDLVQVGSIEFMFDAEGAEAIEEEPVAAHAQVEIASGPATAPISFGSISPFGARRKDTTGLWYAAIAVFGALAIAAAAWAVYHILHVGG